VIVVWPITFVGADALIALLPPHRGNAKSQPINQMSVAGTPGIGWFKRSRTVRVIVKPSEFNASPSLCGHARTTPAGPEAVERHGSTMAPFALSKPASCMVNIIGTRSESAANLDFDIAVPPA
jgi:hypothetical protein